eukprot:TRINITY_DN109908_c0_g1_i1.p1 TRINITY_DN109908_c0_g1~~TRINITY_DN109908_c0_g1_i1.p1  ORF type:complete len:367 (+),score=53.75 TRINITY_DN109908_c0_g1_i1:38-1102(+)
MVAILLKKQYTTTRSHQRLIPETEFEMWDCKRSTGNVLSAAFSGSLLQSLRGNCKLRANLFILAGELQHNVRENDQSVTQILQEAMEVTEHEGLEDNASTGWICTKLVLNVQRKLQQRLLLGNISENAFCATLSTHTTLQEDDLRQIFELVDDGTGNTTADELVRLLNSASAAIPSLNARGRKGHLGALRDLSLRTFSLHSSNHGAADGESQSNVTNRMRPTTSLDSEWPLQTPAQTDESFCDDGSQASGEPGQNHESQSEVSSNQNEEYMTHLATLTSERPSQTFAETNGDESFCNESSQGQKSQPSGEPGQMRGPGEEQAESQSEEFTEVPIERIDRCSEPADVAASARASL